MNRLRIDPSFIADWRSRSRQRDQARALGRLDDHILKDIGITRSDLFGAVRRD